MRKLMMWVTLAIVLTVVNYNIIVKETSIKKGQKVIMRLAPVDPRSLIQGDYMILQNAIERKLRYSKLPQSGKIVITLDKDGVAQYQRIFKNDPLKKGELLLSFKNTKRISFGAESFFFQEGTAKVYEAARYSVLMVDDQGNSVLTSLLDDNFKKLGDSALPKGK
ncbi:MAG: GDYXXLXY domain-containing protein [Desulfobacterales bacterium]|nr:GDYXXLXY domain-containing protein [Desulfobacterales bacterium]